MATRWRRSTTFSLIVVVVLLVSGTVSDWFLVREASYTLLRYWAFVAVGLTIFVCLAGKAVVGRLTGVLIDGRNKMSLSRLQTILWTVLILSAWLSAVVWNLYCHSPNPLAIAIDNQIWSLVGISMASLVASPLILNAKAEPGGPTASPEQFEMTRAAIWEQKQNMPDLPSSTIQRAGQVVVYANAAAASPADLFQGDEIGNAATLDLGKVQMFFFTVITVLAYALALADLFRKATAISGIHEFATLDPSMVGLLGISHAGYLANKAAPKNASPEKSAP